MVTLFGPNLILHGQRILTARPKCNLIIVHNVRDSQILFNQDCKILTGNVLLLKKTVQNIVRGDYAQTALQATFYILDNATHETVKRFRLHFKYARLARHYFLTKQVYVLTKYNPIVLFMIR